MKTSSIRIRIDESEKARIDAFASRAGRTVSDILRQAAASAIGGEIPGAKERMRRTAVRRSANQLIAILDDRPIELERLRLAVMDLRTGVRELVQCR